MTQTSEANDIAVSVIVPAHNVESYIGQALDSLLGQSLTSLEVLVVDDASTDGTFAVATAYAERDHRVRLFRQPRNGGVSRARNRALLEARGLCCAFVDADDWLHPWRLSTMMGHLYALDLDWLADDQLILHGPGEPPLGRVLRGERKGASRIDVAHLVRRDPPERFGYGTLKSLVRTDFLRASDVAFRVGTERYEDFLFHVDCGLVGARMGLLNEPLYYYRRRPGSLTTADPVSTLEGMLHHNGIALAAARASGHAAVGAALADREWQIHRALAYRRLLADLGRRDLPSAVLRLSRTPGLGLTLAGRLGQAAARRLGAAA